MDYPEIPGYTILKRLGEGGMAVVYLARQDKFDRLVALKVMASHLVPDPSFGERFLREAHIVAQMSHRNFVPVFDVGRHGDYHYMSMEYLPNGDLKTLMSRGLPLQDGLLIAREIASGLHYAASKNFVHRDIKPENILFREDHSAVIGDFGIARQMDSNTQMTVIGTVVGTAHYMSPEQAQAGIVDGRSDLYSLGIIVYEMLTGEVPFDADSAIANSIKHVNEEIPLLPPRIEAFQPFIDRVLAKHPDDRFQTGREIVDALEELEELEFDLIEDISSTGMNNPPVTRAMAVPEPEPGEQGDGATQVQSHSGFNVRRSSGFSAGTGRRKRIKGRTGQRARHGSQKKKSGAGKKITVVTVLLLTLFGAAYWYRDYIPAGNLPENLGFLDDFLGRFSARQEPLSAGVSPKAQELYRQAKDALENGRLYAPQEDNAQYYLTTLLALYPDNKQAQDGITKLYRSYLEGAEQAIEFGDVTLAEEVLNQASQISYYIKNANYVERQGVLRNKLVVSQQQDIIAKERATDVKTLLADAEKLLAADALTTPPGANAYDKFQEALALDPANEVATQGIKEIAGRFLQRARAQAAEGEFVRARANMTAAAQIFPRHPEIEQVRDRVVALEEENRTATADEAAEQAGGVSAAGTETRVASQNQEIEGLLADAEQDIVDYRLTSPRDNNALEKFNRILEIDPANESALQGIEKVATLYIHLAQKAISGSTLDKAARYLDQARKLSPTNPLHTQIQNNLIAAQEVAITDRAAEGEITQQIVLLLEQAQSDMLDGRLYMPPDNNAMLKLRRVLELDADNQEALKQKSLLLDLIIDNIRIDIVSGDLEQAQTALDFLTSNDVNPQQLEGLRQRIGASRPRPPDSEALLAEGRGLGGPRDVDSGNYRLLASLYRKVLEHEPGNPEALEGHEQATRYAVAIIENSIRMREYQIAETQIGYLEEIALNHPQIAEFRQVIDEGSRHQEQGQGQEVLASSRDDFALTQRQLEQVEELLSYANAILAREYLKPETEGADELVKVNLQEAYDRIDQARALDASHHGIDSSLENLAGRYSQVIRIHLVAGDLAGARAYLDDTQTMDLPGISLDELELEVRALENRHSQIDKKNNDKLL